MKCSKAQKLISPYVDNELPERGKKEFETHIQGCENCRAEMEGAQELHQLFVNTSQFEAPYGFRKRVMAKAHVSRTSRSSLIPLPIRVAETVVTLVLIAVGMISGTFLVKGLAPLQTGDAVASLHLDVFESAPMGTLGGAYLAMTEGKNEK